MRASARARADARQHARMRARKQACTEAGTLADLEPPPNPEPACAAPYAAATAASIPTGGGGCVPAPPSSSATSATASSIATARPWRRRATAAAGRFGAAGRRLHLIVASPHPRKAPLISNHAMVHLIRVITIHMPYTTRPAAQRAARPTGPAGRSQQRGSRRPLRSGGRGEAFSYAHGGDGGGEAFSLACGGSGERPQSRPGGAPAAGRTPFRGPARPAPGLGRTGRTRAGTRSAQRSVRTPKKTMSRRCAEFGCKRTTRKFGSLGGFDFVFAATCGLRRRGRGGAPGPARAPDPPPTPGSAEHAVGRGPACPVGPDAPALQVCRPRPATRTGRARIMPYFKPIAQN